MSEDWRSQKLLLQELENTISLFIEPLIQLAFARTPEAHLELIKICYSRSRNTEEVTRCVKQPSIKDILDIFESRPDLLTDEKLLAALENPTNVRVAGVLQGIIKGFIVWASNNGFNLDYLTALKLANELGLEYTLKFLVGYRNISEKLINFLNKLITEYRRLKGLRK